MTSMEMGPTLPASVADRLKELAIELPAPAQPRGLYTPAVRSGNLLYVSGQLPTRNGELVATGGSQVHAIAGVFESAWDGTYATTYVNALKSSGYSSSATSWSVHDYNDTTDAGTIQNRFGSIAHSTIKSQNSLNMRLRPGTFFCLLIDCEVAN